jgi:hypothetical protein
MLTKRARERQAGGLGARARVADEGVAYWPPPADGSSGPAGFSLLVVRPLSELM